jgi:hypothetical protein
MLSALSWAAITKLSISPFRPELHNHTWDFLYLWMVFQGPSRFFFFYVAGVSQWPSTERSACQNYCHCLITGLDTTDFGSIQRGGGVTNMYVVQLGRIEGSLEEECTCNHLDNFCFSVPIPAKWPDSF